MWSEKILTGWIVADTYAAHKKMEAVTKAINSFLMEKLFLQLCKECAAGEGDEHGEVFVSGEDDYGGEVGGADFFGADEGGFHRSFGGDGLFAEQLDGAGGVGDDD